MVTTLRKTAVHGRGARSIRTRRRRHRGRRRQNTDHHQQLCRPRPRAQREPLSGGVAAEVKAAALAEVPGATVLRTQSGGPYGTPYHAHVKTTDGDAEASCSSTPSFNATAVQADQGRGGPAAGAVTAVRARAARPR